MFSNGEHDLPPPKSRHHLERAQIKCCITGLHLCPPHSKIINKIFSTCHQYLYWQPSFLSLTIPSQKRSCCNFPQSPHPFQRLFSKTSYLPLTQLPFVRRYWARSSRHHCNARKEQPISHPPPLDAYAHGITISLVRRVPCKNCLSQRPLNSYQNPA